MKLIKEFKKYCAEQEGLGLDDRYVEKVYLVENEFYPDEFAGEDILMSGKNRFYYYYGFAIDKAAKLADRNENDIEIYVDIAVDNSRVAIVDKARGKLVLSYAGKPRHFSWDTEAELAAELLSVIEMMVEKIK